MYIDQSKKEESQDSFKQNLLSMCSFLPYLHKSINRITLGMLIAIAFGCNGNFTPDTDVYPRHFKVQMPFILNTGIMVNTYWGNEKKHHVLYFDNHSPSWIRSSVIQYNKSFKKSRDVTFKTSTADGSGIHGDVGICDSIFFEGVAFINVPFYLIPGGARDSEIVDGVLGIDALSKGVWKIDFITSQLIFASTIDSFSEVSGMEIFPAKFGAKSISVGVDFGHDNIKSIAIDFGYDGDMLLPGGDFKSIPPSSKTFTRSGKFNTPAGEKIVKNISVIDTVRINQNWFVAMISSNDLVAERLLGLAFFRRFNYVIIDFPNKRIYVPKKVW